MDHALAYHQALIHSYQTAIDLTCNADWFTTDRGAFAVWLRGHSVEQMQEFRDHIEHLEDGLL